MSVLNKVQGGLDTINTLLDEQEKMLNPDKYRDIKTVVWFSNAFGQAPKKLEVHAYSDADCNMLAGLLWDTLDAKGFHMISRRP